MLDHLKQNIKLILHCLLINRNDAIFYRWRTRKYVDPINVEGVDGWQKGPLPVFPL